MKTRLKSKWVLLSFVDLNLGNVDVVGSSGSLVFGKNNGGGIRNFRMGMS